MAGSLEGITVLVVEDDFLVSLLFDDMLKQAGCTVLGPVPRLADALRAAGNTDCDVALLDINLAGEYVYPVASVLSGRNVPFIFVTGYANSIPQEFAGTPRLGKPFTAAQLQRMLLHAVERSAGG